MKTLPSPPTDCADLTLVPVHSDSLYKDNGLGPWYRIGEEPLAPNGPALSVDDASLSNCRDLFMTYTGKKWP
jgi:hypothetical protein